MVVGYRFDIKQNFFDLVDNRIVQIIEGSGSFGSIVFATAQRTNSFDIGKPPGSICDSQVSVYIPVGFDRNRRIQNGRNLLNAAFNAVVVHVA